MSVQKVENRPKRSISPIKRVLKLPKNKNLNFKEAVAQLYVNHVKKLDTLERNLNKVLIIIISLVDSDLAYFQP